MAGNDAVGFVRALRRAGLAVPVGSTVNFVAALGVLDPGRPDDVYWAGRATLVRRPEDIPCYDSTFASFFLGAAPPPATGVTEIEEVTGFDTSAEDGERDGSEERTPDQAVRFSAAEVLRRRDFAACTPAELEALWRAIAALRVDPAPRRARRLVRSAGAGERLDLRRTVAGALATDGELVRRRHRRRAHRPRRVVLLVDVSGSMELYARALVRFAHAVLLARRSCEVFTLGTRLTRLTRELATRDPDAALRRAAGAVVDWSGGTRLGAGLGAFCDRWGQRGMARGAIIVVLSDGWDRGDPAELDAAMARLHRLAHRVVWVNPLKASPGYAPLARGMAAALPYCDAFVEGHSLASLESLAALLASAVTDGRR